MEFKTKIGVSYQDKINIYGYDLAKDLIGEITLVDMAFLGVSHRKPTVNESLNACYE
jgi:citrate synthase